MFGDIMGNLEQQQAEMQKKLSQFVVEESMEGVKIFGNATKQITNIQIDDEIFKSDDKEMMEDLLLSCFNRFILRAQKIEAEETQKMMESMMPPGFGDLFK